MRCSFKRLLGVRHVVVVLLAGVPLHFFLRLAFDPRIGRVLVPGIGLALECIRLAAGRKKIPPESLREVLNEARRMIRKAARS